MKCDTCLNSRHIVSENGIHRICCLSSQKATNCLTGRKDHWAGMKPATERIREPHKEIEVKEILANMEVDGE